MRCADPRVAQTLLGRAAAAGAAGAASFRGDPTGATTVVVAATPQLTNGGYYEDCQKATESDHAKNAADAAALFEYCDQVTKEYQ